MFIPHINDGLLLWGRNLDSVAKFQKRAIRTITNSNFIAHSEPLLKELRLLNVYDMHDLKVLKFMYIYCTLRCDEKCCCLMTLKCS